MDIQSLRNRLLSSLTAEDFERVGPHLNLVTLDKGARLYDPGDVIETIYFPENGVISLMTLMQTGEAIESATIGREGGLGLLVGATPRVSLSRAIVQVAGEGYGIGADHWREAWKASSHIRELCDCHSEALFGHAIQSAACNALHSVEARFCRWLLCCHDRIDSDTVSLTQEFLADMLGVQRTTVTVVARALQAAGLIRYRRGVVDVLDRARLEQTSCECYGVVRQTYERLLPSPFS